VKEMWLFMNEVAWSLADVYSMTRDGRRIILYYNRNAPNRTIEIEFPTEEEALRYWKVIAYKLSRLDSAILMGEEPK
jgi:hypothetical protein